MAKTIPLSQLDRETIGEIWVINTAAQSAYEIRGNIVIGIPNVRGGEPEVLTIPQTWLPVQVTAEIPRIRILESTQFRKAVAKGLISCVSEQTAERMLRQEGSREEQRRLLGLAQQVRDATKQRTIADSKVEMINTSGQRGDDDYDDRVRVDIVGTDGHSMADVSALAKAGLQDENGFSSSFVMFANLLKTEGDVASMNAIKSRGKLKRKEIRFLAKNLHDHPKTVKFLKNQIARFEAKDKAAA
jgi:hypothetical protein